MNRAGRLGKMGSRHFQLVLGLAAVVVIGGIAAADLWVFRSSTDPTVDSFWKMLSSDRATGGFVRVAIVALSLYVVVSVVALVAGGRWLKAFSPGGLETDPAASDRAYAELRAELAAAEQRYEETRRLLEEVSDG